MKINVRITLITFLVVVIVSGVSSLVYYSTTNAILESRNTKNIINSTNDFVFFLESSIDKTNEDFQKYYLNKNNIEPNNIDSTSVDLIFSIGEENQVKIIAIKTGIIINRRFNTFKDFVDDNPHLIVQFFKNWEGATIYYAIVIDEKFLNEASKKIRADVALMIDNLPYNYSNSNENSNYVANMINSQNKLKYLNNFDIINSSTSGADFVAVKYQPKNILTSTSKFSFLVFSLYSELYYFTDTMKIIIPVIILTGIVLAMIFALVFTAKFRKQISLLTEATTINRQGNLDYHVPIISKDEIGNLGVTFNQMISEINNKEKLEKQYAEFIVILNQNITLKDLSHSVLVKILESVNFKFGAIYLQQEDDLSVLCSIGLDKNYNVHIENTGLYKSVIEQRESVEMKFEENMPVIRSAILEIEIRYLVIVPIIFGDKLLGLIELVSETIPIISPREFLEKIKEQLAIGLNNSLSYQKLSKLVDELKQLNEEYHKQNIQISGHNEELVKLHSQLKEKASELEEEKRKAVELSHVKSQFLASMSHELKTPLNSIIGLSELTEKDPASLQKTKDRVKIVLRNGKKLLGMINNILEFSKIEAGKYDVNKQNFLLSEFLTEIYLSSEILFSEKQLPFTIKINSKKNLLLNSDKTKVEHILLNLISNAAKFTDIGSVTVNVEKVDARDVKFSIVDTGIGISENNQQKIFNEFSQVESGNSRKYSGAGLGLAICARYAEILNASIGVNSLEGIGSTFTLLISEAISEEIPFHNEKEFLISSDRKYKKTNTPDSLLTVNQSLIPDESSKTLLPQILLVDDDKDTLYTVGEILTNLGYNLHYASNGIECLAKLEEIKPDLILLDIMMPEMDGFETIKKIRASESLKYLKVFALTAHAMLDDKHIIEQTGFDDLITKPVENTTIQLKVKQAIINNKRKPV